LRWQPKISDVFQVSAAACSQLIGWIAAGRVVTQSRAQPSTHSRGGSALFAPIKYPLLFRLVFVATDCAKPDAKLGGDLALL
jgi:hypothetical protein